MSTSTSNGLSATKELLKVTEMVKFRPEKLCSYFIGITQLSHPVGNENPIREWIVNKVKEVQNRYTDNRKNVEVIFYESNATDPIERNIVLRRNGNRIHRRKIPVVLQAHMNMICLPSEDIFSLKLASFEEQGRKWVKAYKSLQYSNNEGIAFGADTAIGIATILTILEDEALRDTPLECLFTVQKETNMEGAKGFDKNLLTGRKYINLNAKQLNRIVHGSVGGSITQLEGCAKYVSLPIRNCITYDLSIYGLKSGHSGIDINKRRANAIKELANILLRLNKRTKNFESFLSIGSYDILLQNLERGDDVKANVIPQKACAQVSLPKEQALAFEKDFRTLCELAKQEHRPVESGYDFEIKQTAGAYRPQMTEETTDSILLLLHSLPHGVMKVAPKCYELVETSANLYNVEIGESTIKVDVSNKSLNEDSLGYLDAVQSNFAHLYDYESSTGLSAYPVWQLNLDSQLLWMAKEIYCEIYGENSKASAVHDGSECGWIMQKYNEEMDCISIGPTIENPHTPNERLEIGNKDRETVLLFYNSVKQIIYNLYND